MISSSASPGAPDALGERYEVRHPLGVGGMAEVLLVYDRVREHEVALKRLSPPAGEELNASSRLRFQREFHTMAGLLHPSIVEVYDFGVANGREYYTMEVIEGRDLQQYGTDLPLDRLCLALRDVTLALALVHRRGFVHRDVTARNVRLTDDGRTKLMDFGVLATVGSVENPAGSAPYVAPEILQRLPIDNRVDFYALGALMYFLLTGRHAYPAPEIRALPVLWDSQPPAPSILNPELPPEIDAFVAWLMSPQRDARPNRASEIVARLGQIADLPPPADDVVMGFVQHAGLVGRAPELSKLRDGFHRALDGRGGAVMVAAPSGTGKSRLLRELAIEVQVTGQSPLWIDGRAGRGSPFGVLRTLVAQLLEREPARTSKSAEPYLAALGRALPELCENRPGITLKPSTDDPAQDRANLQEALVGWLSSVCQARPLVVMVDDIQVADDASLNALRALVHEATELPLYFVMSLRTDERTRTQASVELLHGACDTITLKGLSDDDVRVLVTSMLGDVNGADRLTNWLQTRSSGNPMLCTELLRYLVEREVVRLEQGEWLVPDQLELADLPSGLLDTLERTLAQLSRPARSLAEVLAVYGVRCDLEVAIELAESERERAFAALDELCSRGVLLVAGDGYRFRHDSLREALLRKVDDHETKTLHGQVADAMRVHPPPENSDEEAHLGWHLYRAGRRAESLVYLERAARRSFELRALVEAIPALEAAVALHEESGSAPKAIYPLLYMLINCGVSLDNRITDRYFERTLGMLEDASGMTRYPGLSAVMPRRLALLVAFGAAVIRYSLFPRARRQLAPWRALAQLPIVASMVAAVFSGAFDFKNIHRPIELVKPFASFRNRFPRAAYLLTRCFADLLYGTRITAISRAEEAQHILETDRSRALSDADRTLGRCGALYTRALLHAQEQEPQYAALAQHVDGCGQHFLEVGANLTRVIYHRCRGEEAEARSFERVVEVQMITRGQLWMLNGMLAWTSGLGYAVCRDLVGLRVMAERIAAKVRDGMFASYVHDVLHGEWLREAGRLDDAERTFRQALAEIPKDELQFRCASLAGLSETLLALGRLDDAEETASRGIDAASAPNAAQRVSEIRSARVLAMVDARRGNIPRALQAIEQLLERVKPQQSPSLMVCLHEAGALIARDDDLNDRFEWHLREMVRWGETTKNPALLGQPERLREAWSKAPVAGPRGSVTVSSSGPTEEIVEDNSPN